MAKVLFLALDVYAMPGGLQRFNRRVIAALANGAQAVSYILRDHPTDAPPGAATKAFGGRRLQFAMSSIRRALSVDTVLVSQINLLPIAWVSKLLNPRLRLVLFVHGVEVWDEPQYRRKKLYEPFMLGSVDRIASVSQYTARIMARAFGLNMSRFALFPNAVDGPLVASKTARETGALLAVTRLAAHDRGKNMHQLLRAFARLPSGADSATLQVVGDGALRAELEELAASLGISGRVQFLGSVTDERLDGLYDQAQAFVLPSSKEGFGIVYLEAWKHGLPVICGSEGASSEIVTDGEDGFVVDPNDITALTERMALLLSDPQLRAEMGRRGMAKLEARYLDTHFRGNLAALLEHDVGT